MARILSSCASGSELFHKTIIKETFDTPQNGEIEAYLLQLLLEGIAVEILRNFKHPFSRDTFEHRNCIAIPA